MSLMNYKNTSLLLLLYSGLNDNYLTRVWNANDCKRWGSGLVAYKMLCCVFQKSVTECSIITVTEFFLYNYIYSVARKNVGIFFVSFKNVSFLYLLKMYLLNMRFKFIELES